MNRQKAEDKSIGRRHRQKEVGIGRRQMAGQGKEKERQPARQGNNAAGEKDRWIILILCINFAARTKYINK